MFVCFNFLNFFIFSRFLCIYISLFIWFITSNFSMVFFVKQNITLYHRVCVCVCVFSQYITLTTEMTYTWLWHALALQLHCKVSLSFTMESGLQFLHACRSLFIYFRQSEISFSYILSEFLYEHYRMESHNLMWDNEPPSVLKGVA